MYIYFYVTSFNRILNAADGQTQTQPRPILHWSVYVHFICISHYFRKLLSPPCHHFPSKMFREDTTETSHWRAGLWETLSYTMQVNWSYASLRQTSPPTPVWTKFFEPLSPRYFYVGILFILAALEICPWQNLQFAFSNWGLVVKLAILLTACIRAISHVHMLFLKRTLL